MCSPNTSAGFYGPFGNNYSTNTFGYQGSDAVLAQCPAGQLVVGVTTSFATLGGFNSFQVSGHDTHGSYRKQAVVKDLGFGSFKWLLLQQGLRTQSLLTACSTAEYVPAW